MANHIHDISTLKKNSPKFFRHISIGFIVFSILFVNTCFANGEPEYDEIPVFITVPGLGSTEIPALISKEQVYLSINGIFDFLKIKNVVTPGLDTISGVFIDPRSTFTIDKKNNHITYGDKIVHLMNDELIQTETSLYLRLDYFGKVFGLDCTFNFRSLSVILNTKLELPVIREMRQEVMRNNIRKLKGDLKADTNILRRIPVFHVGVADWSVVTTQNMPGANNTRLNLGIGAIIGGGETTLSLNYDNHAPFCEKEQYYLWRLVNNERRSLRQISIGKIFTQSVSSIYSPVVGVQFTNTPTTYRRSFGTYVLSDHTEPNWLVELYVNNVLVNYVKADASGFYTFEIPLVYGNSSIKLRFFSPWGEDHTTEQNINIPFNFLPHRQFEYTLSAGVVEDSSKSRFSRLSFNYGMGRRLTIGGGMEYLSSLGPGKSMPFINASLRLASNILISSEYIYGVRMKDILSYRHASNLQFELSYSKYKRDQKSINNTYLEERKAVVSYPFRTPKISLFSRMTLYQIVLPSTKYTNTELLLSGVVFGIHSNLTTYALMNQSARPFVYSQLSSTFRVRGKLIITPQVEYEYNNRKVSAVKGEIGKPISGRGYANVYYEKKIKSQFQSIGIGFRYDFSFAQVGFSARRGAHATTLTQSARGSMIYNTDPNYFDFNSRNSVGKGGINILPFVDLNGNGKRDKNEPRVAGLKTQIGAGRLKYNTNDSTILISDLEPYTSHIVKLNTDNLENISLQLKMKTLNIEVSPNQMRLIEVPLVVMNEISGTVWLEGKDGKKGLGRMIVSFYNKSGELAGQTQTETDGYYSYAGLTPGAYTAKIEAVQLSNLHFTSLPGEIPFDIKVREEGEIIDEVDFILRPVSN